MSELSKADRELFEFGREYFERKLRGDNTDWQCRPANTENPERWSASTEIMPHFRDDLEYRFAPKTITINGVEVVAPRIANQESEKLVYVAMDPTNSLFTENLQLPRTFVFDNLEDQKAFGAALAKAIKGE